MTVDAPIGPQQPAGDVPARKQAAEPDFPSVVRSRNDEDVRLFIYRFKHSQLIDP